MSLSLKSKSQCCCAAPRSCPATCGMPHILLGSPSLFDRFISDILNTQAHAHRQLIKETSAAYPLTLKAKRQHMCGTKICAVLIGMSQWSQVLILTYYELQKASNTGWYRYMMHKLKKIRPEGRCYHTLLTNSIKSFTISSTLVQRCV